jgi:hypothetical protein
VPLWLAGAAAARAALAHGGTPVLDRPPPPGRDEPAGIAAPATGSVGAALR